MMEVDGDVMPTILKNNGKKKEKGLCDSNSGEMDSLFLAFSMG